MQVCNQQRLSIMQRHNAMNDFHHASLSSNTCMLKHGLATTA